MKIKRSAPAPPWSNVGTFFLKKLLMGEQTFFGEFMGEFVLHGV